MKTNKTAQLQSVIPDQVPSVIPMIILLLETLSWPLKKSEWIPAFAGMTGRDPDLAKNFPRIAVGSSPACHPGSTRSALSGIHSYWLLTAILLTSCGGGGGPQTRTQVEEEQKFPEQVVKQEPPETKPEETALAKVRALLSSKQTSKLTGEDIPWVNAILNDSKENENVRAEAAAVLGDQEESDAYWQSLRRIARDETNPKVRSNAIWALGKQGKLEDIEWLIFSVDDVGVSSVVRHTLTKIMVRVGEPAVTKLGNLLNGYYEYSPKVNSTFDSLKPILLESYHQLQDPKAKIAIISVLWKNFKNGLQASDMDATQLPVGWSEANQPSEVRQFGIWANKNKGLDDPGRRGQLIKLLEDEDLKIRTDALSALQGRVEPEVWVALKKRHPKEIAKGDAKLAEQMQGTALYITNTLEKDIVEGEESVRDAIWKMEDRRYAFALLGEVGDKKDIEKLIRSFDHPEDAQISQAAEAAVKRILVRDTSSGQAIVTLVKALTMDGIRAQQREKVFAILQGFGQVPLYDHYIPLVKTLFDLWAQESSPITPKVSETLLLFLTHVEWHLRHFGTSAIDDRYKELDNDEKNKVRQTSLARLNDEQLSVRRLSIVVLGQIATIEKHPEILAALSVVAQKDNEDGDVKKAASEKVAALKQLEMYQEEKEVKREYTTSELFEMATEGTDTSTLFEKAMEQEYLALMAEGGTGDLSTFVGYFSSSNHEVALRAKNAVLEILRRDASPSQTEIAKLVNLSKGKGIHPKGQKEIFALLLEEFLHERKNVRFGALIAHAKDFVAGIESTDETMQRAEEKGALQEAKQFLRNLGKGQTIPDLMWCFSHDKWQVRDFGIWSSYEKYIDATLDEEKSLIIPKLLFFLDIQNEANPSVRRSAVNVLGEIAKTKENLKILDSISNVAKSDPDEGFRRYASETVASLKKLPMYETPPPEQEKEEGE